MAKQRVDTLLVARGAFESRTRAAAAVLAGEVQVGSGGRKVRKPGQLVDEQTELTVAQRNRYVSRGGIKLENALSALGGPEIAGRRCLDAGASTGGFTDLLLQNGAAQVIAVDVGYGELDWGLRQDPRVTVLERCNVRTLTADRLDYRPELIVVDLSFISLSKVLPALVECAAERFDMLALVKPQFEVGKALVGKGGVVRDSKLRREAIAGVAAFARELNMSVCGVASSQLPGPAGNRETFLWLAESARSGVDDLDAAIFAAEPGSLEERDS